MATQEKFALISVYDKSGISEIAQTLQKLGYKIISTGGTAKILKEAGVDVISVEEITNFPESFDGRVKTISSKIEAGILFDRGNPLHVKEAKDLEIKPIDIVICNLYPFEEKPSIENIDIGGPAAIRSAAKNYQNVLVITSPKDYSKVAKALEEKGVNESLRKELAQRAFEHTSFYDSLIAQYFRNQTSNAFPDEFTFPGRKTINLRYGENQYQKGSFYTVPFQSSVIPNLEKKGGRDLSFINVTDINAGVELVRLFKGSAATVIKHNSPCGIALGDSIEEALGRAIEADPESAFGGIVVLNQEFNQKCTEIISRFKHERLGNMDIIASPSFEKSALESLLVVRKSMGVYSFGQIPSEPNSMHLKFVDGGFILQTADNNIEENFKDWKVVTKAQPTPEQLAQMKIAWKFISRIRSNAIIVMDPKLPMTRGIGSGQTSRVRSVKIALEQAGKYANGSVLASDSFFPFGDSVKLAAEKGISALIQEGGSINDSQSIEQADKADISMVFTSHRAFWH